MTRYALASTLGLLLVLTTGAGQAVTIQWTIGGEVDTISQNAGGALDPFVAVSDSAVLTFDVESDATDTDPSPATGRYAASNLVFEIGSLTFSDASFELRVDNGGLDGLFINSNDVVLSSGGNAALQSLSWQFRLELYETSGNGLASDALPLSALDPAVFDVGNPFLVGGGGFASVLWDAQTAATVPEPSTGLLVISGIVMLAGRQRHRHPRT